jgi:hypothetical protein
MILDNVLDQSSYTEEDMNIMFVEGFLYALEMQENGEKASSMEELSEALSEAANNSILETFSVKKTIGSGVAKAFGFGFDFLVQRKMAKKIREEFKTIIHSNEKYSEFSKRMSTKCENKKEYMNDYNEAYKNSKKQRNFMHPYIIYSLKSDPSTYSEDKNFIKNIIKDFYNTKNSKLSGSGFSVYASKIKNEYLIIFGFKEISKYDKYKI